MFKRNPDRIFDRRTEGVSGRRTDSVSGREPVGVSGKRIDSASRRGSGSASGRSSGGIFRKTGRERLLSLMLCFVLFLAAAAEPAAVYAGSSSGASSTDGSTDSSSVSSDGSTDSSSVSSDGSTDSSSVSSDGSTDSSSGSSDSSSDSSSDASEDDDDAEPAESWRYSDGEPIEYPDTDSLNAISTLTTPSVYSTWKKSYGTSYYGIYSSSGTTKVAVSGVKRIGIDVSKWQGSIDWEKVAADGIDYAIIRCGYGSNSTDYDDPYFLENVAGAQKYGIEIGIYLYSYATTTTKAQSEVKHVLRLLDEAGLSPASLDLPIFYDMEDDAQTTLTVSLLGDIAETFCDGLLDEGYAVGVYASKSWWNSNLVDERFLNSGWYKWVARYPVSTSVTESGTEDTDIWQFSSRATVSGISTRVDVNFDYLGEGAYTTTTATLKASLSLSQRKVTLSWSKVSGADGYRIYRSTDGGSYEQIAEIEGDSTLKYADTVELNKTYKYKIKAYWTSSDGTVGLGDASNVKTVDTTLSAPTISSSILTPSGYVKIYWDAVDGADGYEIYRSTDGGSYELVKTITDSEKEAWTDTSVKSGKVYRYKIRSYAAGSSSDDTSLVYSAFSAAEKFSTTPSKVGVTLSRTTDGSIKLTWKKHTEATGYEIYRSTDGGSYKLVKTITSRTTLKWKDTTVKAGRVYRYKVRAYATVSGTTAKGAFGAAKKITAKPGKVTISSAVSSKSRTGKIKWKKVENVTGYQIAYRVKGSSKWYYKTTKSLSKTLSSLKSKKTYSVKVRAYKTYNGKKYYGAWSTAKTMKVK